MKYLLPLLCTLLVMGCNKQPTQPTATPTPTPVATATPLPGGSSVAAPISWDRAPGASTWSNLTYGLVDGLFAEYDSATDSARLCTTYGKLTHAQKVTVWVEFISAISKFESAWKPTDRYQETGLGTDSVTGLPVWSEGLLQLSYQDVLTYKSVFNSACGISWSTDKALSPTDPNKTILNPQINLTCGSMILGYQIKKGGTAIKTTGGYWSTIESAGKYGEVPGILALTNALPFCRN